MLVSLGPQGMRFTISSTAALTTAVLLGIVIPRVAALPVASEVLVPQEEQSAKHFAVALVHQQLDQLADAEASYERAILTDAGSWKAGLRQKLALYGEVLQWQGKTTAAREVYAAAVQSGIFEHPLERPMVPMSDARVAGRESAWYDTAELQQKYPSLERVRQLLEAGAGDVRAEYLAYRAAHPGLLRAHPDRIVSAPPDGWMQLPLAEEKKADAGARFDCHGFCPRTAALLQEVEKELCFGQVCPRRAEFSILRAGAKLRPHCGPTNLSLTLHLGLICPGAPANVSQLKADELNGTSAGAVEADDGAAAQFCLAGVCQPWREGRLFVFNEAFEHEAQGAVNDDRVVLLLKVPHPGLPRETYERLYAEYLGNSSLMESVRTHGEALFLQDHIGR